MSSPARTTLYGLELAGVETEEVESFGSYIMRLATAHHMNLVDIASFISFRVSVYRLLGCDFHGVGERAAGFIQAVELATGQTLEAASMGRFRELIGPLHLTMARSPRYCPVCVRGAKEDELPYGRLTWELSFVKACPVHRARLMSARVCGASEGERLRVGRRPVHPGVCGTCGSIGFRCCGTIAEPSVEELWVAREAGKIVALPARIVVGLTPDHLRAGIEATVRNAFGGKPVRAALQSGLARACVLTWLQGGTRPSLGLLFKFAYAANASVAGILQGQFDKSHAGAGAAMREDIARRRYAKHDWNNIRASLIEAEQSDNPPALGTFARDLRVTPKQLRKVLPVESGALVRKSTQRRRLERTQAEQRARERYREAAKSLKEDGITVTAKRLQDRSGLHLYKRDRGSRRNALVQVLAESEQAATDQKL